MTDTKAHSMRKPRAIARAAGAGLVLPHDMEQRGAYKKALDSYG